MSNKKISARVLFDYEAQENDELSLRQGEIIEILSEDVSGWWTGNVNGRKGLIPGGYVEYIFENEEEEEEEENRQTSVLEEKLIGLNISEESLEDGEYQETSTNEQFETLQNTIEKEIYEKIQNDTLNESPSITKKCIASKTDLNTQTDTLKNKEKEIIVEENENEKIENYQNIMNQEVENENEKEKENENETEFENEKEKEKEKENENENENEFEKEQKQKQEQVTETQPKQVQKIRKRRILRNRPKPKPLPKIKKDSQIEINEKIKNRNIKYQDLDSTANKRMTVSYITRQPRKIISNGFNENLGLEEENQQDLNNMNESKTNKKKDKLKKKTRWTVRLRSGKSKQNETSSEFVEEKVYGSVPQPQVTILNNYLWKENSVPFLVIIDDPKKESKFKSTKKFTTYAVSHRNVIVRRRFKHFVWFRNRLCERYESLLIPHLPKKEVLKRFREEFILKRLWGLEKFVNRVIAHPILRNSSIVIHFLNNPLKGNWKPCKREIERENREYAPFYQSVNFPKSNNLINSKNEYKHFKNTTSTLNKYSKTVTSLSVVIDMEYLEHSEIIQTLGKQLVALAFNRGNGIGWREVCQPSKKVEEAIIGLGSHFESMGKSLHELVIRENYEQSEIFKDFVKLNKNQLKLIKNNQSTEESVKSKTVKIENFEKTNSNSNQIDNIKQYKNRIENEKLKGNIISKITVTELESLHFLRTFEFKETFNSFVDNKILYHDQMAEHWGNVLKLVDQIPCINGSEYF
ncbi:sorting nexin [Anaeramoeba flamelloides]|uniref:Sorting nexin n=1 Tax=Anaeramoeba flamelloides TaxID=1746091 RepID=A0ABQ8X129_9EUKA|nr:sorting nexin [Anaeramoeba flamelloides]